MIINFNVDSREYIEGQPKRKAVGQQKRVDGLTLCYDTTLNYNRMVDEYGGQLAHDIVHDILTAFVEEVLLVKCSETRDWCIPVSMGNYGLRLTVLTHDIDSVVAEDNIYVEISWSVNGREPVEFMPTFEEWQKYGANIETFAIETEPPEEDEYEEYEDE